MLYFVDITQLFERFKKIKNDFPLTGGQEAAGSNPVTRTMRSVLIGSEDSIKDTLLFYAQN